MNKFKVYILFLLMLIGSNVNSQVGDLELRNYFNAMVFLKDSATIKQNINGIEHEVYLKNPNTKKLIPMKSVGVGSGFFISKGLDDYLVTAQHVGVNISKRGTIAYRNASGKKIEVKLEDITYENENWVYHQEADVAVLHLNLKEKDEEFIKGLEIRFIDYWYLMRDQVAPDRFTDLHVVGYPLGLGVTELNISPITKKVRVSSDILVLPRADRGNLSHFFLLDDPSTSGFSGGPIVYLGDPIISKDKKTYLPSPMRIMGLVHGTISDPKDKAGRFSAIVPSYLIAETIDLAPSFEGTYTYKYPNGKLWSRRIYKNGIPWTVIDNYDPEGKPQEKGTLKDGTGTLNTYDAKGKLIYVERFEKGIRLSLSPVMTTEELEKFGGFAPAKPDEND
ncbi:trypsin-like peptidase domain-containing protein [Maribacter cobaltidurans]|uniref:Uncharacterized protein n=1 Tax=Maribacter cobaltidurans TaxID=1178778 RepID=A0A223VBC0_9FLAO|nr:trypsin-like peptidase domain-containing protein [Maribacter cobaltidurans]ASV32470.1 hypothetical protein CJ263_20770 [Maribacter cobaltidurans]GGD75266.1 hypothetical protein GCM10011412_11230 [Maribacter cobaltidurans]